MHNWALEKTFLFITNVFSISYQRQHDGRTKCHTVPTPTTKLMQPRSYCYTFPGLLYSLFYSQLNLFKKNNYVYHVSIKHKPEKGKGNCIFVAWSKILSNSFSSGWLNRNTKIVFVFKNRLISCQMDQILAICCQSYNKMNISCVCLMQLLSSVMLKRCY